MIQQEHPFFFLAEVFAKQNAEFCLSKYVYRQDSLADSREVVPVRGAQLSQEWLLDLMSSLEPDEELALHSRVVVDGRVFHIPMIDFAISSLTSTTLDRLRNFLPKRVFLTLGLFDSGRSYHGYSPTLLKPKDWIQFMGRLLLVNPRDGSAVIDTRWVGHRLIGGYCSLRWSNNTGLYVRIPEMVGSVTGIGNMNCAPPIIGHG